MKTKILIAAGVALFASAAWYLQRRMAASKRTVTPQKQHERHHLASIFSSAKELALGN